MSEIIYNNINFEHYKSVGKYFKKHCFVENKKNLERVHKISKNIFYKSIKENIKCKRGNNVYNKAKIEIDYNKERKNDTIKINFFNETCNLMMIIILQYSRVLSNIRCYIILF